MPGFRLGRKRSASKAVNANTTYITMLIERGLIDLAKAHRQLGVADRRHLVLAAFSNGVIKAENQPH
jgi:hypothetical protein